MSDSAAPASRPPAPPLWTLVLITLSGTLAIHIFVPALPTVGRDLGVSMAVMQNTISLYILGLAVGQLMYGPLADGFGRRPVLLVGMSVFFLASVAAAVAPSADTLIAARVLQALGGCSGLVLGRVIVRDTSTSHDTVRRLALMNLMTTLAPAAAPLIGATIAASMGWRMLFVLLAGLGAINLWLSWRWVAETGRPTGRVHARGLASDYWRMLGNRRFVALAVGGSCATMSVYAILVASPFILVEQLGRSTTEMGVVIMALALGMTLGNAVTSRLAGRVRIERLLIDGNLLAAGCAVLFTAFVLLDRLALWNLVPLFFCYSLSVGFAGPGAVTKAISVDPRLTGTASGLYGACQMMVGAIATIGVGWGGSPALAAGLVLVVAGVIAQGSLRWAMRAERLEAERAASRAP